MTTAIPETTHGDIDLSARSFWTQHPDDRDQAFAVLRDAAEVVCATVPAEQRPPSLMVALHVWSMSHGIASLFARADQSRRKLPMSPEELLEAGVLIYLQGLGIGPKK